MVRRRHAMPLSAFALAAAILALTTGCSHYSFSSAVKTHISTIAIPVLVNETL